MTARDRLLTYALLGAAFDDQCRAELAQAKANQCDHGIDRRRGACGECGAAAAKSTETETKTSETKES